MNKIKIGKRKWKNKDGKKQKAHTFTYKENNKKETEELKSYFQEKISNLKLKT